MMVPICQPEKPDLSSSDHQAFEPRSDMKNLGISEFSRHMAVAKGQDTIYDTITHDAVELLQVDFGKLLRLENNGHLICKSVYFKPYLARRASKNPWEASLAGPVYDRAMYQETPWALHVDSDASPAERQTLYLNGALSLLFIPLRISFNRVGLMVLGTQQEKYDESSRHDFKYLASVLTVQTSYIIVKSYPIDGQKITPQDVVMELNKVLEKHSPIISAHTRRLVWLVNTLSHELNLNLTDTQALRWSAMLHDIGKIAIPDSILLKPGRLTESEWEIMKKHPVTGANMISMVDELGDVEAYIQSHHEYFDGSGYPYGLKGEQIPLGGRIISVIDAYCAMTEGRIYQAARTHNEAIEEIRECNGRLYDPRVAGAFLNVMEREKTLVQAYRNFLI
ncbi:MAG: HD domain-containing phosphohydrolase [Anaerolineaceae bacterium]|jgi:putative nucleotidyltransferase with HDIG domain